MEFESLQPNQEGKEKHIHKFRQANLFSYPIFEDGKEVWVCEDLNCSARELRESKKAPESRGDWSFRFDEKFPPLFDWIRGVDQLKDFIKSELTLARTKGIEEVKKLVIEELTEDITSYEFEGEGKSEWEVLTNRGVEPCIECSNGGRIRNLIASLQTKETKNNG